MPRTCAPDLEGWVSAGCSGLRPMLINSYRCAVLQRVEMTSVVCFQWVTAISTHFGVSSRKLGFLGAPGGVFVVRGGGCHSHFPAAGWQRLALGRIALVAELPSDAGLRFAQGFRICMR